MSDPVADTLGQLGDATRNAQPGSDIVAPPSGLGVTSVDVEALAAQIAALQGRLDAADHASAVAAGNPLADTVTSLQGFLAAHGDPVAVELGNDLAAAVKEAGDSGDTSAVSKIAAKLDRRLTRNAPYPGDNHFYNLARAFTSDLPDIIDDFKPIGAAAGTVAKVVAGSVIG